MSINELFATTNEETTTSARQLSGTAQLNATAKQVVDECVDKLVKNAADYRQAFEESKVSHGAMDKLISELVDLTAVDVEFLKDLDDDVIDGMLKSQQSKRSRAKSKAMTFDNYETLMTGAVAENLIRLATGRVKSAGGTRRAAGAIEYSEEQLKELQADQDLLKKEIRNVQSKKSIMKAKADFDETCERWQSLLVAESQLKALRVSTGRTTVVHVDETKDKLAEVLADVDTQHLKAGDSKELLEQIKALLG